MFIETSLGRIFNMSERCIYGTPLEEKVGKFEVKWQNPKLFSYLINRRKLGFSK